MALGQQLAVNEAIAMPRAGGNLFAVNGPPGTGKTTMLRDLIAGFVTERAERLAALTDPADAFLDDPDRWETTPYRRVIHRLRPELTGFELVLASSNNGAVENVTLEIPSSEAVDGHWRELAEGIDYFPALAERAMSAGRSLGRRLGAGRRAARQQQEPQGLRQRGLVDRTTQRGRQPPAAAPGSARPPRQLGGQP